jgi:hypothetical protein
MPREDPYVRHHQVNHELHYQYSNTVRANQGCMTGTIPIEIVGLADAECSPFPCDADRTCGLSACHPAGKLIPAFEALKKALHAVYDDRVLLRLTLIDDTVPDHIRTILETEYPPLPIILVNGRLTRIGRIALDRIMAEIDKEL